MAIADLQVRQGNVNLIVEVIDKGMVREFEKFGKKGRVCNAKVKDDSGEISLTLWNDDVDKVNVGARVHIKNGYVNEYEGEKQLTTGKFGSLEVIEKEDTGEPVEKEMTKIKEKKKKGAEKKRKEAKKKEEELEEMGEEMQELEREEKLEKREKKQAEQPEEIEDISEEEVVENNKK